MISQELEFHAPADLAEVLALLAAHREGAKLLGGGMSLVPAMNLGLARPTVVVSLNHVSGLAGIEDVGDEIVIGAATTHAAVVASPVVRARVPLLAEAAAQVGDVQVRNRGTIGGSAAHADPAADELPVLLVTGATMVARSAQGTRRIPADDFFVDILQTALRPDEVLTELRVPTTPPSTGSAYRRLARVEGSFAIVGAAALVTGDGTARLALGGVQGRPIRLELPAAFADGTGEAAFEPVAAAVREACAGALEDLNADAEYRREMAVVYARRALEQALLDRERRTSGR